MIRHRRMIFLVIALTVASGSSAVEAADETELAVAAPSSARGASAQQGEASSVDQGLVYHVVGPDETLGLIAMEYNVALRELTGWNDLASIHDVEPGMKIVVGSEEEIDTGPSEPLPVIHIVKAGDTFEGIANQYGVRVSHVRQWNRRVNPRRLQIGQQVRLHIPGSNGASVSWGRANGGRLYNGVAMEDSPGLRVRNQARSYGTKRVLDLLYAAGADLQARWPDAPDLVVGSLSVRNGGPLRPHRSHQSGRDVDITYFHRGNVALPDFRNMTPEIFDAAKNWHLFKTLIDSGEVQFMFVDYELQRELYEYAIHIGYTPQELEPLFQYPRGARVPAGVIRHARGHRNHVHIRFACGPEDQNCR